MWVIKTCGRQFTASCICLTLHLAERSAHLLGIRGGDVIRRSVEWMAQTSECSAKTLALSWHSLLSPHSECLQPSPTYSCSAIITEAGGGGSTILMQDAYKHTSLYCTIRIKILYYVSRLLAAFLHHDQYTMKTTLCMSASQQCATRPTLRFLSLTSLHHIMSYNLLVYNTTCLYITLTLIRTYSFTQPAETPRRMCTFTHLA